MSVGGVGNITAGGEGATSRLSCRRITPNVGHPNGAPQIPPLRFAPVPRHAGAGGMTERGGWLKGKDRRKGTEDAPRDRTVGGLVTGFYAEGLLQNEDCT